MDFAIGDRVEGRHIDCYKWIGTVTSIRNEGRRKYHGLLEVFITHVWKFVDGAPRPELTSDDDGASSSDPDVDDSSSDERNDAMEEIENDDPVEENGAQNVGGYVRPHNSLFSKI